MSNYIGIDLGTTYSAVATIDATGRPKIIENNGKSITPSCVMLENDKLIVGEIPEKRYGMPGFDVGARFKRYMGEEHTTQLGSKSFTPTDLSAAVLKEMLNIAKSQLGEVSEAVITIPANVMQEARDATLHAAGKAGIKVNYIINEPTAAALFYGHQEGDALNGYYAVYDLGGGTFDVSIVKAENNNIEVIATEGVLKLGGDDFDKTLRDLFKHKFQEMTSKEAQDEDVPLSKMAELKVQLSEKDKVLFLINGEVIEVTRTEFEEKISSLINQAEFLCETALEHADLAISDLKAVYLAGGSTRIPAVMRSIKKVFDKEPIGSENVDEVVALGAALYAAMKSSGEHLSSAQSASIKKLKVSEIATYFFGTLSLSYNSTKNTEELGNSLIISKGEKIPCSRTEKFSTIIEGQTAINCTVTKSGSPETDPRFVSTVWEGTLDLPDGRPAGMEIEVTYSFDENGMMHCKFLDVESGRLTEVDLDNSSEKQSASEIDKFLVE